MKSSTWPYNVQTFISQHAIPEVLGYDDLSNGKVTNVSQQYAVFTSLLD
jgi:hypothetical protein